MTTLPLRTCIAPDFFEICGHEGANAFFKFEQDAFKQARKVCINSILHTDNAHHFEMVKCVKDAYELCSDICDAQSLDADAFSAAYLEDVLYKSTPLWHKLILHLCDVSNPLKPWSISRLLATHVQDEFFRQGDEEKKLGIPVGMLNDRDVVNRPGSQHGFISFLVAPLVFATVDVFPMLRDLSVQMASNMQEWRHLWVEDAKPDAEAIAKKDADVNAKVAYAKEQFERIDTVACV
jgi:hypothetical protein